MTEFPAPDARPHPGPDPARAGLPVPTEDWSPDVELGDGAVGADGADGADSAGGGDSAGDAGLAGGATRAAGADAAGRAGSDGTVDARGGADADASVVTAGEAAGAPGRDAGDGARAAGGRDGEEPLVTATRNRLAELDGTPVASHVAVYDELHGTLQGALAGLDEG